MLRLFPNTCGHWNWTTILGTPTIGWGRLTFARGRRDPPRSNSRFIRNFASSTWQILRNRGRKYVNLSMLQKTARLASRDGLQGVASMPRKFERRASYLTEWLNTKPCFWMKQAGPIGKTHRGESP